MMITKRFDRIDNRYLEQLVRRAAGQDSNAFAELFAAVCDRQLYYLIRLIGSGSDAEDGRSLAVKLLKTSFVAAYSRLPAISDPGLFMVWISRISADSYLASDGTGDAANVNVETENNMLGRILSLPLIESQIILMHDHQHLSIREIAEILNFDTRTVKRFLKRAAAHLREGRESVVAAYAEDASDFAPLSINEISGILEEVYEANGADSNNIPVSELSLYTIYRSERFTVQRAVLAAGLIIFMILPLCFIMPEFTMSENEMGRRGLPEYDVRVSSWLPVHKVVALIGDKDLPVYEADARSYMVEPTGNGQMAVSVELINRQRTIRLGRVSSVDSEGPRLTGNTPGKDTITLHAEDDGVGIDYHRIYAVPAGAARGDGGNISRGIGDNVSGTGGESESADQVIRPISADDNGIVFSYPDEDWDIYIPDRLGNTLHLRLQLN